MSIITQLEAILYIAGRPLSITELTKHLKVTRGEVEEAFQKLSFILQERGSGLVITRLGDEVQIATHSSCTEVIASFLQEEVQGELTRPALETLTILSYRGPMTKGELENIRGINCTLILRNLAIKGLVVSHFHEGIEKYQVSFEFLKLLGCSRLQELPDYEGLNKKVEEFV